MILPKTLEPPLCKRGILFILKKKSLFSVLMLTLFACAATQKRNMLRLLVTVEGVSLIVLSICLFHNDSLHVRFYLLLLRFAAIEAALGLAVLVRGLRLSSSVQASSILYLAEILLLRRVCLVASSGQCFV